MKGERGSALDLVLVVVALAIGVLFFVYPPSRCAAQEAKPAPLALRCPEPVKCGRAEGAWVGNWQIREMAAEIEKGTTCLRDRALADQQLAELKAAMAAAAERDNALKAQLAAAYERERQITERHAAEERRTERRTRWAISATVATALLAGTVFALASTR